MNLFAGLRRRDIIRMAGARLVAACAGGTRPSGRARRV